METSRILAAGDEDDPTEWRLTLFGHILGLRIDYRKIPRSPGRLFRAAACAPPALEEREFSLFPDRLGPAGWPHAASPGVCASFAWMKLHVYLFMYPPHTIMAAAAAYLLEISGAGKMFDQLVAYGDSHISYQKQKLSYLKRQVQEAHAASQSAGESVLQAVQPREVVCLICMEQMPATDLRKSFCFTPNCQAFVCHGCVDKIVKWDKKCPSCRQAYDPNEFQMTGRTLQPASVSVQQAPVDLVDLQTPAFLKEMYDQLDIDFNSVPEYILHDYADVQERLAARMYLYNVTAQAHDNSRRAQIDAVNELSASIDVLHEYGTDREAGSYDDYTFINHPRPLTRSSLNGGIYHRKIDVAREYLITTHSKHFSNLSVMYDSKFRIVNLRRMVNLIHAQMTSIGMDQSQLLPHLTAMVHFPDEIKEKVQSAIDKYRVSRKIRKAEYDLESALKEGAGAPQTRRLKRGDGGWSRHD